MNTTMRRFQWCAIAATVAFVPATFARKQVLKNGSFEAATPQLDPPIPVPNDWSQFGRAQQSMAQANDGLSSALVSVRDSGFVGMFQDTVTVEENVRILMRALAYIPSDAPIVNPVRAGIKLEFFPPEGLVIPPPEENLAFNIDPVPFPEDTWVPVTYSTTVPPDIDTARIIVISFDNSLTNGPVYIDSAFAERSSATGVNQLVNPSFESGPGGANGIANWTEFADPASGARLNAFEVPAQNGTRVCRASGRTCGLRQDIPVVPGETLNISAFFRSRSTLTYASIDARAGVKVEWIAGAVPGPQIDIAPNANPISGTTNTLNASSPVNTWTPVTIDYTIPPNNAAKLRGTIINGFGPAVCDVYFDSFEFVLTNVFDGSDADGDDDEDVIDIAGLQRAYRGAGGGRPFGGLVFDHDEDGDVDFTSGQDAPFVLSRITGPALLP
ncbi:MAG: hypothetical protein SF069_01925 [Phycisphaerae bacterium]|nr:hypothetical protein [Phycisphaerae bacterium]